MSNQFLENGNFMQEMIEPPKAAMTPWDAMASFGDVDRAFTHLESYMEAKRGGAVKNQVAKGVKAAASTTYKMPVYTPPQTYEATQPAAGEYGHKQG